jgi:hypothetical protein
MNFIKRWIVSVVRADLGDMLDARKEDVEYLSHTMLELRNETDTYLERAEVRLNNSLGRILAENDARNQRDAQCLANAMLEERRYKGKKK